MYPMLSYSSSGNSGANALEVDLEQDGVNDRAHLLSDLRPYSCISETCSSSDQLFETREQWIAHELENHHKEWWCDFPHEDESILIFRRETDFTGHLEDSHASLFNRRNLPFLASRAMHPSLYPFTECPFCETPNCLKLQIIHIVTYEFIERSQKLQEHIARHLEYFAAFAVLHGDPISTSSQDQGVVSADIVSPSLVINVLLTSRPTNYTCRRNLLSRKGKSLME